MIKAIKYVNAKLNTKKKRGNDEVIFYLIILCWRQGIIFLNKW